MGDRLRDLPLGAPLTVSEATGEGFPVERASGHPLIVAVTGSGIAAVLSACRGRLKARGRVVIVVNDRRDLYPQILERAGLVLEQRYQRHVNRRTGRRAGEYFEDVLVAMRT